MKYYLVEENKISELAAPLDTDSSQVDFHFYQNPDGTLFYSSGNQLHKISLDTAKKIKEKKLTIDLPSSESKEARKLRIKRIKDALNSGELYNKLETERLFSGEDEAGKWNQKKPILSPKKQQLKDSIQDFVESEYGYLHEYGYGKDNPMSVDPEILKKVRKHKHSLDYPLINVYFDRSGSWDTEYTNKFAKEILDILADFDIDNPGCEDPLLKVNVYYFAVHVWKDEQAALKECNNSGEPIIQHMIENEPENVIIMTDHHLSHPDDSGHWPDGKDTYMKSKYVAKGAVWAIFVGGEPKTLIKGYGDAEWHLAGQELTKVFTFDRGEEE